MADNSDITLRLTIPQDKEEVTKHLRNFFFKDEPCNKYLDLINDERPICKDLESFCLQFYDNGLNIVAECNGKIVGVCFNIILERGQVQEEYPVTDEKFVNVVRLLEYAEREVDFFKRYPDVDKILSIFVLSVDTSLRGKGIAKKLCNKAKEIAKEHGVKLITVECTSFYSAAVSKSLGFELIWSFDYENYKVNGEVVLKPAPPHKSIEIYVSKL